MAWRKFVSKPNFNSTFEVASGGSPAKLTLEMSVTLVPLDPSVDFVRREGHLPPSHLARTRHDFKTGDVEDADGDLVACRSWLVSEWLEFKERFQWMVELTWNNQLILLPVESNSPRHNLSDADFKQLIGNPRIHAHVKGELSISLSGPGEIGHAVIEVVKRADPTDRFRNEMNRISDSSVFFRRHKDDRWKGAFFGQPSAAHEIGHWLREEGDEYFVHIDADYVSTHGLHGRQADRDQYGHTLGRRFALMGAGNLVTEHEATPWLNSIKKHAPAHVEWMIMHRVHFDRARYELPQRQIRLTGVPPR